MLKQLSQNKPISKAKSHKNLKLNKRALPYTNSSLPLKDRLLYLLLYQLQFRPRLTFCAQTYADMLGSQDSSYISELIRSLRDDHRFIISLPQRRYKSKLFLTLEIQLSPCYKQLLDEQPHGSSILERSDSILLQQQSVYRVRVTNKICEKLDLNFDQRLKLEAYPLLVLQKAWRCMRWYLKKGKFFYKSAFSYFNAMLDRIAFVIRDTIKKMHEPTASFALYYQKRNEAAQALEWLYQESESYRAMHEPAIVQEAWVAMPNENYYWSDFEERE